MAVTAPLPTAESLGLTYDGECPEFASHGFTGRTGVSGLFTRHGQGFGRPVFEWRGRPMYFVTGSLNGIRPYDTPWDELQRQRRVAA